MIYVDQCMVRQQQHGEEQQQHQRSNRDLTRHGHNMSCHMYVIYEVWQDYNKFYIAT